MLYKKAIQFFYSLTCSGFRIEPISKISFEEIFKYLAIMQGGFRSSYQRESGKESQRSRMGKDAENSQKVFLRWALVCFGPDVIKTTLVIPIMLVVAFAGLVFYMRGKKPAH
jgi:hypothetical protein